MKNAGNWNDKISLFLPVDFYIFIYTIFILFVMALTPLKYFIFLNKFSTVSLQRLGINYYCKGPGLKPHQQHFFLPFLYLSLIETHRCD